MFREKPYTFVIGGLLLLLLILVTVPILLFERKQGTVTPQTQTLPTPLYQPELPPQANNAVITPIPAPSISFDQYELKTALPVVPSTAEIYTFKTQFTSDEIKSFAQKFGLTDVQPSKENPRYYLLSNKNDQDKRGVMSFDSLTGSFNYSSFGSYKPKLFAPNISPLLLAQLYLQEIEMNDGTVVCKDTYETNTTPGAIYVECHRDPEKSQGLALLGYPAIINIPEDTSLKNVKVGNITAEAPEDKTIINSSNGNNGKVRSNDTNTLTIAFDKASGRIISIQSNIRKLLTRQPLQATDFVTPQEALDKIKTNNGEGRLVIPAGKGVVAWDKVYPDNKALGKNAAIQDFILTYLEMPGGQNQTLMAPYYVVRGTSVLNTGYTTRFAEIVPATRKQISFLNSTTAPAVAGTSTYLSQNYGENMVGSQKQGNFQVGEPSLTPTPPAAPIATLTPTIPTTSTPIQCTLPTATREPVLQIPGLGEMKVVITSAHMYYFKSASFPVKDLQEVRNYFYSLVEDQYSINVARWLSKDSSLASYNLASTESAYQLYDTINNKIQQLSNTPGRTQDPMILSEAPQLFRTAGTQYETSAKNVANKLVAAQATGFTSLADRPNIFPDYTLNGLAFTLSGGDGSSMNSMCYIAGSTPSLFVYSDKKDPISIKLGSPLTYTYPAVDTNNTWNITTTSNGLISILPTTHNLPPTTYLYYEYNPTNISFTQPQEGWIIKKTEMNDWIKNTFAKQLGLTENETTQMINEVKNSLNTSTTHNLPPTTYLRLSLADEDELNRELPLSISPQPRSMRRIHLLISPIYTYIKIPQPSVQSIKRDPFTVIELGAKEIN